MTNDQSVHFLTGGGSADPAAGSEPVDPNAVGAWLAPDQSLAGQLGPQDGIGRPARPGRPSWRRLLPRSLTSRLVSGVVSLVVVLVLATGAGTYFALRSFLYERLDQQLPVGDDAERGLPRSAACATWPRTPMPNCFGGPPPTQTEWLTLISSAFSFESTDTNRKMLTLSAAQQAQIAADPSRLRTIDADGTELRVSAQTVAPGTVDRHRPVHRRGAAHPEPADPARAAHRRLGGHRRAGCHDATGCATACAGCTAWPTPPARWPASCRRRGPAWNGASTSATPTPKWGSWPSP